ncbi:MAG: response regulator transcription factor [Actinomycetota bacterium]
MVNGPDPSSGTPGASSATDAIGLGVVLIDPLPVVRAGIAMLIDEHPDLDVLAEAGDAQGGLRAVSRFRGHDPIVIVGLDLEGELDAYRLIAELRERFGSLTIVAAGAKSDPISISRALFVGADGFVDKNVEPGEFLRALHGAHAGETVLVGPAVEAVGEIADGIDRRREVEVRLTAREREVLTVAAEGLTARQIGERLGVRERTVTTHLGRIYGKLGVGTRLAAIRAAARSGLVSVGGLE